MQNKLSERQKIEKIYHDKKFKDDFTPGTHRGASSAYKFYWKLIRNVSGLKILDFGCGNGWLSIRLAKAGAEV